MKNQIRLLLALTFLPVWLFGQGWNAELLYHWADTTLPGSLAYNNTYNECWGFVKDGREYAIIGSTMGTHIFDVTDPALARQAAFVPGASQGGDIIHRDFHDYNGYLYSVCDEGPATLQIIDLSPLPDSVILVYDSDSLFRTVHNIFIDSANALLYACGVGHVNGPYSAMKVFSLANPVQPGLVYTFNTVPYIHDAYVRDNIAFLNGGADGLLIYDFTIPTAPVQVGWLDLYSFKGYNHSGWLNEAGDVYLLADENHGLPVKVINTSDLSDVSVVSTLTSGVDSQSIPHNVLIRDNLAFVSYYHDGLQVFDISNPQEPEKVAYYKTYEPGDHISYRGAWGTFPYLPSRNVIVSDMQYGLFLVRLTLPEDTTDVGIKDPEKTRNLVVYPNPVAGNEVYVAGIDKSRVLRVDLITAEGRVLLPDVPSSLVSQSGAFRLALPEGLPQGRYILRIETENGVHSSGFLKLSRY